MVRFALGVRVNLTNVFVTWNCFSFWYQIVDMLVKLLSPRQEDDEKQEMAADLRETIERHDEQWVH